MTDPTGRDVRDDPTHPADPRRPLPSDPTRPFEPILPTQGLTDDQPFPVAPDSEDVPSDQDHAAAERPAQPESAWDEASPFDVTRDSGDSDEPSEVPFSPSNSSEVPSDEHPVTPIEPPTTPQADTPPKPSRFRRPTARIPAGRFGRFRDPRIWIATAGALAVLIALLASEPGLAIMLAAAIIPLAIIVSLDRVDVFDREPALILLGIGAVGTIAGVLIGLLNGFLLDEFWEKTAVDRIGVIGLAGELSGRTDSPPVAIYALAGIVVPALSIAAMLAAPVAARRWTAFRNEAMDGITLAAAAGGGFTLGTAAVHLWPLVTGDPIAGSVADWTVAILSIVLFRPIIVMAVAALVGLAIWRFDLSRDTRDLIVPLAAGLGGAIAYALLGLLAEQSGATIQLIWSLAVAAVLLLAGRSSLHSAIVFDRRLLAGNRVVCPNCRQVTPAGKFCAFCQKPLPADAV